MNVEEITNWNDSRLIPYSRLTEAQLYNRLHPEESMFIAESPKVIKIALDCGYHPFSLLCERKHIDGDAKEIIKCLPEDTPVFTSERSLLAKLTGYTLTLGVLCAMHRPQNKSTEEILNSASRICILDGVCDTTNIGAIFRSAAALGIDAILLTPSSCDPFNRRSIRVSMGTVFLIPWTRIENIEMVKSFGFKTVALALRKNNISLCDESLKREARLAIILGTEGDGLSSEIIETADFCVKIPMFRNIDSLNVGAAAAIAFWELKK